MDVSAQTLFAPYEISKADRARFNKIRSLEAGIINVLARI